MKRTITILSLAFVATLSLFLVSTKTASAAGLTLVGGTVHLPNNVLIAGATVTVSCHHGSQVNSKTTQTGVGGGYLVGYPQSLCAIGDSVVVSAVKGNQSGQAAGTVHNVSQQQTFNVGLSGVTVTIPEFGPITGGVAALFSTGSFLFLKRRNSSK